MYAIYRNDATSFIAIGDEWGEEGFVTRFDELTDGALIKVDTPDGPILVREHYDLDNDTSRLDVIGGDVGDTDIWTGTGLGTRIERCVDGVPHMFYVDVGKMVHKVIAPAGYDALLIKGDATEYIISPAASTIGAIGSDITRSVGWVDRVINPVEITDGLAELISLGFRWETALDWQDRVTLSLKGRGAPLLPACFLTNRPTLLEAVRDALEWARENRTLGNADLTPGDLFIAPAHTTTEPAQ